MNKIEQTLSFKSGTDQVVLVEKDIVKEDAIDLNIQEQKIENEESKDVLSKNNYAKYYENSLSAICFKILHDHQKSRKRINSATSTISLTTSTTSLLNRNKNETESLEDVLTFVRVYSGELVAKSKLYNVNKQEKESCDKIYIPYANQLKQANRITSGNIGIVSGLSKVQI